MPFQIWAWFLLTYEIFKTSLCIVLWIYKGFHVVKKWYKILDLMISGIQTQIIIFITYLRLTIFILKLLKHYLIKCQLYRILSKDRNRLPESLEILYLPIFNISFFCNIITFISKDQFYYKVFFYNLEFPPPFLHWLLSLNCVCLRIE